jgi:hypothetical protein
MGIDWRSFDSVNGKSLDHAAILSAAKGKSGLAKSRCPRQSQRAVVAAFGGRLELHANTVNDAEIQHPCGLAALCPRQFVAKGGQVRAHGCRPIITLGRRTCRNTCTLEKPNTANLGYLAE